MNSGLQFYDNIPTDQIQQILIKVKPSDLISLENPNYQYVAARLLLFSLRKQINRRLWDPHLHTQVKKCVELGVYDKEILKWYDKGEFDRMNTILDHDRDYSFTYAGLRQVMDKYLVQDRSTGEIFETTQQMYMMIAATIFAKYPKNKKTYLCQKILQRNI